MEERMQSKAKDKKLYLLELYRENETTMSLSTSHVENTPDSPPCKVTDKVEKQTQSLYQSVLSDILEGIESPFQLLENDNKSSLIGSRDKMDFIIHLKENELVSYRNLVSFGELKKNIELEKQYKSRVAQIFLHQEERKVVSFFVGDKSRIVFFTSTLTYKENKWNLNFTPEEFTFMYFILLFLRKEKKGGKKNHFKKNQRNQ